MFAILVVATSLVVITYLLAGVAPSIAEIKANADVRKARVEARADLALGGVETTEPIESEDDSGTGLDGIARLLGYPNLSAVLTDPNILKMIGLGKNTEETEHGKNTQIPAR